MTVEDRTEGARTRNTGRITLLLVVTMAAVLLFSTAAYGAIKVGTDGADTIVGTNSADHITGKDGNDVLEGRAGNDVYHFVDGFGTDVLKEPATVKVGKKKLPGGTDTLSFAGVTNVSDIYLIPQWRAQGANGARVLDGTSTSRIDLGTSLVEKAVGGSGGDAIYTGSAKNTLNGGAGGNDLLVDFGGYDGYSSVPGLPASDDTYKGFTVGPGMDTVYDYGGTADVLDLRSWESSDVYLDAVSVDGSDPSEDTLVVSTGDRRVSVYGHFKPVDNLGVPDENGTMEKIVFADETITSASEMRSLVEASPDKASPLAFPEPPEVEWPGVPRK